MCGIIAYIGPEQAYSILVRGLERLEYRGYDSAGVATVGKISNGTTITPVLHLNKVVGKVKNLYNSSLPGNIGIAHTRWATHGAPTQNNAHPHHNPNKTIAVVHNGIIENYSKIKKRLQDEGYSFYSDTDTEVLTNLIDFHTKQSSDFITGIKWALHDVVGAYGIVVINKEDNRLYAARKGSPLVLGIGEGEYFIASDPSAFVDRTRRVLYLEDDDMLIVDSDKYELTNHKNHENCQNRKITHIDWDLAAVEKNGYETYMIKEIKEQAESLKNCILGRLDFENATAKISLNLPDLFFKNLNKIFIAACGTSWHAALVGKYLIEKYCRIPVEVDFASEFRYKNPIIGEGDLLIVMSQSGETADTLAALREAKEKGAKTLGIINVVGSTIAREVDSGIYIHAGPEIGVASTKAFTGQVLSLNLLSLFLGRIRDVITKSQALSILEELQKVPEYIEAALIREEEIKMVAQRLAKHESCFFLGKGINFPTALEGSLKLKEISYIHSEAFPSAEMKHGPIALLESGFPTIFCANNNDPLYEKIISSIEEVRARGAQVIVVANANDMSIRSHSDHALIVPTVPDYIQPIINSIPLQLLAYHTARFRGCEIDQPRNLAKSVTVE